MFVYILHFNTPLKHAKHYIGSTDNLQKRLKDHATGQGARLTQVLKELEMDWSLSTLYTVKYKDRRRIEKLLKKRKNGPRYCKACNREARVPLGCIPWDIQILRNEGIAITSQQIREKQKKEN